MKAMVLRKIVEMGGSEEPLEEVDLPVPVPGPGELLLRVMACGVCHTELDEIEGRLMPPQLPVVLGHQVVGRVEATGPGVEDFVKGERVGVAWIYSACGRCRFCVTGRENLCADFKGTGKDVDGGYAEYMKVRQEFAYPIPSVFSDVEAAPLLCAGAIGYRSLVLSGIKDGDSLGLSGFGASAHLILKVVRHKYPGVRVFVFARSEKEREFAMQLGAHWSGDTGDEPPERPSAIIDTTPAWKPVVEALRLLDRGGRLVINAIRKEENDKEALLGLGYPSHLWLEKEVKSVANVTRKDVSEFLDLAARIPIKPEVEEYTLREANRALRELRERKIRGAKVLRIE